MYELRPIKIGRYYSEESGFMRYYDDDGNPASPVFRTAEIIYDNVIIFAVDEGNEQYTFTNYGLYDMDSQEMLLDPKYSLIYYDSMTDLIILEWLKETNDDDEEDNEDDDEEDDDMPVRRVELFVSVRNNRGQSITGYAYDSVTLISNTYILARVGTECSLFNLEGKRILGDCNEIHPINARKKFVLIDNILYAKRHDKKYQPFGINIKDKEIFPTVGKWCKSVTMCYRCGYKDDGYYVRKEKNIPQYAKIYNNGKYGVVDINAHICIPTEYDEINFYERYIEGIIGKHEYVFNEEDFPVPSKESIIAELYKEPYYLFFDTETTGTILEEENHSRLVQIAWLLCDKNLQIKKKRSYIIKPDGFSIPKESVNIHGITTLKAKRLGENIDVVLKDFIRDYGHCRYVVGHNIAFDIKMLNYELLKNKYDIKLNGPYIDTMLESIEFCDLKQKNGESKYPKLTELYIKLFGETFDDAHDAMADINATYHCFCELKNRGIIEK